MNQLPVATYMRTNLLSKGIGLSEDNLAVILNSVGDALLATNAARRITVMNPAAEKLTGWALSEARGRAVEEVFRIVNEQTRQPVDIPVDHVLASGTIHDLTDHNLLIARDGSEYRIDESTAPILDSENLSIGAVLIFSNTTKTYDSEAERFKRTLDQVLDCIFMYRADDFQFVYVNEGGKRQTGYTEAEILKMTVLDIKRGFTVEPFRKLVQPLLDRTQPSLTFETIHRHKDGHDIPVEVYLQLQLEEGREPRFISIVRDITESKHTQKVLADFKAALDEHAIVAIADAHGTITYVNNKFCEISKYSREELIGQNHPIVDPGMNPKAFIRELWQTIFSERTWKGEVQNRAKDGSSYWVDTTIVPFLGPDGKPSQYIAIQADITTRKQAEIEIVKLNEHLRQRAAELETLNKELEAFSYSVAHDLRAPLRHIDGYAALLTHSSGSALDDRSRKYLNTIARSAKELGTLMDELLVFSKMGRSEIFKKSISLGQLVGNAVSQLDQDAQGRSISWNIGALPQVRGDPAMLQLVMINLLSNALKYTRTRAHAEIEMGHYHHSGEVVVFVRDNGVGFDMRYVHKLFGVFQRLHSAKDFEGTGIGLANVRRIIHRHGGKTWAEGVVEGGASFYFSLPSSSLEAAS